jgi:hypothetical protein
MFLHSGSDTTIRHNTQITHITQNNTPHSNKAQHTKLHTTQNEYSENMIFNYNKNNYNYKYIT